MLKKEIQDDIVAALKKGDSFLPGVLRMLSASIISKEKEKRYKLSLGYSQTGKAMEDKGIEEKKLSEKSELSDQEIIQVISSEIKKRRDAIALYIQGKRQELAEKEEKEIEALQKYLPEQLSEEEIKKIVAESIEKTGAKELKDMGKVMQDLNPKIKGRAEGSKVSEAVKELLSK